jgi:hypothetical protein
VASPCKGRTCNQEYQKIIRFSSCFFILVKDWNKKEIGRSQTMPLSVHVMGDTMSRLEAACAWPHGSHSPHFRAPRHCQAPLLGCCGD